jgi:hypothetical protein
MSYTLSCDGTISVNAYGGATCSTGWAQIEAPVPFEVNQIDPAVAINYFGLGFLIPIVPLAIALGAKLLIRSIRNF